MSDSPNPNNNPFINSGDSAASPAPKDAPPKTKEDRRNIGSCWTKTSAAGDKFLSGSLNLKNITGKDEKVAILIFKNKMPKFRDSSPDFTMVLVTEEVEKRMSPEEKKGILD